MNPSTLDAMSRRKNRHGYGSIRNRGGDAWQLRYMVDGAGQQETYHGSEKDAHIRLKRLTADAAEGRMPAGITARTVGDVLRWRLKGYRREKPASLAAIESYFKRLLASELADIRVVKLRRADLSEYAADLVDDGLATATVNRHMEVVRAAFRRAAEEDPPLVVRVPKIDRLAEDNIRQGFLKPEQYEQLMEAIKPGWLQLMFAIGYHVGARAGSILATKRERIDWDLKVIRAPANQPANKRIGHWPIYGDLEKRLRMAEMHHEEYWAHVPWLIHRDGERLASAGQYRHEWVKATKLAGLKGLLFHDLRRTAARNLLDAGNDETRVCKVIGWKSSAMLYRYNIVDELAAAKVGAKTAEYLERQAREREREERTEVKQ